MASVNLSEKKPHLLLLWLTG